MKRRHNNIINCYIYQSSMNKIALCEENFYLILFSCFVVNCTTNFPHVIDSLLQIKKELNTRTWKKVLDQNLKDMYSGNCWGVPSFKITDSDGSNPFYVWGQDRMWLLKEEINKRLG